MKERRDLLVADYMEKFSCIGPQCEDNCCYGWVVEIDKATYKKYKKVSDKELKGLLDKRITRNRSNLNFEKYAKVKMDGENCSFLGEDKLCMIHKSLGASFLSKGCDTYPRITNVVDGVYEKSNALSCPEAARVALLNPKIMEFNKIDEPQSTRNIINKIIDSKANIVHKSILNYFWDIRIFIITLLQNRDYKVWERLIFLGLFINKLQSHIENKSITAVPKLIEEYNEIIESGELREQLENIPVSLQIQMEIVKEINDLRFSLPIANNTKIYIECVFEFLKGVEYTDEATLEEITERYKDAIINYYEPFMSEHEYIYENYLVNYVFKNIFPDLSNKNIFDEYIKLIVYFSLIKMNLIGMSRYHKQLNEELIIKLVYSFSRAMDHDKVCINWILKVLKQRGFDTLPYMAILIKN